MLTQYYYDIYSYLRKMFVLLQQYLKQVCSPMGAYGSLRYSHYPLPLAAVSIDAHTTFDSGFCPSKAPMLLSTPIIRVAHINLLSAV